MANDIGIGVATSEGKVVIDFNVKVDHMEFTPEQAVEFAEVILKKVITLTPKRRIILPSEVH